MESAASLCSLRHSLGTPSNVGFSLERPGRVPVLVLNVAWPNMSKSLSQSLTNRKVLSSLMIRRMFVSCVKTSDTATTAKSDDSSSNGSSEKNSSQTAKFPNGFEDLILEVCDQTEVAELKLKVGAFEMHLKRNTGTMQAPFSFVAPTLPPSPPVPSEPVTESAPAAHQQSPQKSSAEKVSPFTNAALGKSTKLAALEASATNGYVLVSSPAVGIFRRGRTVKGKRQPPVCKEGDAIKEGQTMGFLDQFGTELPIKSDAAGKVLKILYEDGEAVGYGDPLAAVS